MRLNFAITPCPNDVFSYHKEIDVDKGFFNFHFHDIEMLNQYADEGRYEITKLSFPAWMKNRDKYILLDAGAALGIDAGPVLVSSMISYDELSEVAVPGLNTTAALLFNFYSRREKKIFPMLFSEILPSLVRGDISAGVLIHEGRFVYKNHGLKLIEDLGKFWSRNTNLPIPLGCICIRKDFLHLKEDIENRIRVSVKWAFDNESRTYSLMKKYAQHLDDDVLRSHVFAFVNEYSYDISDIRERLILELEKIWKL